ncbi:MAG TPA: ABC transporter permease subunit [Candidatus Dormibacteraeota bacterium]|jgi:ABC-type transport system involved in multi-copper enzyme maturation permease subunit|nr:ABC transporter permease subunit [Candidatus Dormibacteraeota bacterium]
MRAVVANLLWNPIVEKELRSRMRTWRAPCTITLFLFALGAAGYVALLAAVAFSSATGGGYSGAAGPGIFGTLTVCELILILFIAPALTAGAISGERDRQTLDLLLVTPVRPVSIVLGKLIASLAFVVLLILLSVPLFSFVFLFGGVALDQLLSAVLIGLVTALVLGSFGLLASTLSRGSIGATVGTYIATFLFLILPVVIPVFGNAVQGPNANYFEPGMPAYQLADPGVAAGSLIAAVFGVGHNTNGCNTDSNGVTTCTRYVNFGFSGGGSIGVAVPGRVVNGKVISPTFSQPQNETYTLSSDRVVTDGDKIIGGPFRGLRVWEAFVIVDTLIAAVALTAATLLLGRGGFRKPKRRRG